MLHRWRLLAAQVCLARADAWPVNAAPSPASRCVPTAENGDDKSGTADTYWVVHATAHPYPRSTARRLLQLVCPATDDRDHRPVVSAARPARFVPTEHRSVPTACARLFVTGFRLTENSEAGSLFMRPVVVGSR